RCREMVGDRTLFRLDHRSCRRDADRLCAARRPDSALSSLEQIAQSRDLTGSSRRGRQGGGTGAGSRRCRSQKSGRSQAETANSAAKRTTEDAAACAAGYAAKGSGEGSAKGSAEDSRTGESFF